MKTDRILEMIIYLLNRKQVSASELAEHFQVSVRTIQRDMVTISAIGIPVYAVVGKQGGYSILPSYKMKNAVIGGEEQQMILRALESLATSYQNATLSSILEKYNAIIDKNGGHKVFWDFSVTTENKEVQEQNVLLEQAVSQRKYISFVYRNARGEITKRIAEPLALHYKWYAWYLFTYLKDEGEYHTFKVARMKELKVLEQKSMINHRDISILMKESEETYYKTCISIKVQFEKDEISLMQEYFPDCPTKTMPDGKMIMEIHVPAKERLWKALLLSFGEKVTVIEPVDYQRELIETAQNFLSNYDI